MTITQEELKKRLHYDPKTGIFTWILSGSNKIKKGDIAGNTWINLNNNKKYYRIYFNGKLHYAHRIAWLYMHGSFPRDQIDHIDGNGLNNRIDNLREVNGFENHQNMRINSRNTSGITGVNWHKRSNKWQARIQVTKKVISLGLHYDFNNAVSARKNAEVKYGFHKNHGSDRPL
ncbi:MAG: HNH endonuclease [Saprospiraceae bacterium]|nr:HNH endonuclease [Saprospiraceae bacterium]MBP9723145.1 HNH endonuclease [Gammaproteobacteria bacterium]